MITKLPFRFLDVGPHRWKVVMSNPAMALIEEEVDSELWGVTDWTTWTITLRSGVPGSKVREILIHELTHVVYGTYPHDKTEESIAQIMGIGFTSILAQNRRFALWLIE